MRKVTCNVILLAFLAFLLGHHLCEMNEVPKKATELPATEQPLVHTGSLRASDNGGGTESPDTEQPLLSTSSSTMRTEESEAVDPPDVLSDEDKNTKPSDKVSSVDTKSSTKVAANKVTIAAVSNLVTQTSSVSPETTDPPLKASTTSLPSSHASTEILTTLAVMTYNSSCGKSSECPPEFVCNTTCQCNVSVSYWNGSNCVSNPKCVDVEIQNTSVTNSTFTISINNTPEDVTMCGKFEEDQNCTSFSLNDLQTTFQNLESAHSYSLSLYAYIDYKGSRILSNNPCLTESFFTKPNGPVCEVDSFVKDITDTTITLNVTTKDGYGSLCVKRQPEQKNNKSNCTPLRNSHVIMDNLTPATSYNFTLYSFIGNGGQQQLSTESCFLLTNYTKPKGPICNGNNTYTADVTTNTITLTFSSIENRNDSCVEVQPAPADTNFECKPIAEKIFQVENLIPGTLYNFSLYSFNVVDNERQLSTEFCAVGGHYTIPFLNCTRISWNSYGIFGPLEYSPNIVMLNISVTSHNNSVQYSFVTSPNRTYVIETKAGRNYTAKISGKGPDGSWTPESCEYEFSTELQAPQCPIDAFEVESTHITVYLAKCNFKEGTTSVEFMYNGISNSSSELTETIVLSGLTPGSKVNITIYAKGENGIPSESHYLQILTKPSNPICSEAIYSSSNSSININVTNMNTKGAIHYRITLNNIPLLQSPDAIYVFTDLSPGQEYTATVEAIGKENKKSQKDCNKTTFTRPNDPVCKNATVFNRTTTALGISLENVRTNDAIYYVAEYDNTETRLNATWNESNYFRKHITDLTPGKQYNFSIFAVGKNELKSSKSCYVTENARPIPPSRITNITIGNDSFTIQWNHPPSAVVESYNVTTNCNCSCTAKVTHSGLDTEAEISNISAGTHCSVTIISISGGLKSDPLYYPNIKTNETPPGKVSNFTAVDIKTGGIWITWNEPKNPNGDILSYSIIITDSLGSIPTNVSSTTRNHTFENLSAGSCYNVSIGAVNHAGVGEKEAKTVYTSETVPSKVSNLTAVNSSSTSITVKWLKPSNPNGVVIRYVLYVLNNTDEKKCVRVEFNCKECQKPCPSAEVYSQAVQADTEQTDKKSKDPYSNCEKVSSTFGINNVSLIYEVKGLDIFTSYLVIVQAYTSKGGGANSTTDIRTSADKPSTPGKPLPTMDIFNIFFIYHKPMNKNGIITHQEIVYIHKPYNVCTSEETRNQTTEKKEIPIQKIDNYYTFLLENLKPFWEYKVRVRVRTYAGYSDLSEEVIVRTLPTTPENVSGMTVDNKTSRGILLSWTQPCHPNGNIINYKIKVHHKNGSVYKAIDTNNNLTSYLIDNLLPYRSYTFTILTEVANVTQKSPPAKSETFQTLTEAPFKPGNITFMDIKASSVRVSWKPPILQTGPTRYEASAIDKNVSTINFTCSTQGFENTNCTITGLDAYWNYSLVVRVFTDNFEPNSSASQFTTAQSAPGRVEYCSLKQDENITVKTNVHIEWKPPVKRDLNGIIQMYFIRFWYLPGEKMIKSYSSDIEEAKIEVKPGETYTFQIFAMTVENTTEENYCEDQKTIKPGAPLPLPPQKTPVIQKGSSVSNEQKQVSVTFSIMALCDDRNGEITQWFVIVSKESKGSTRKFIGARTKYTTDYIQEHYQTWKDVYENDNSHTYVASNSWKPHCYEGTQSVGKIVEYILGLEGDCSNGHKYCNGYLEPGKTYWVRYAVCTRGGCLESEYSSAFTTAPNNVPAIAGSVSAVILVALIVVIVVVFIKKRRKGPYKNVDNGESGQQNEGFSAVEMTSTVKAPKAVKIADFASYVQKLHADSNLLFSQEYKLLKETCPTHTTKAAEVQVNRIKNRYTNILSYDHSRVKLLPTEDDEGSDYINANYIPGFSSQREYIATQGPLPFTRDDFWRMIWEQNVSIVVMLTQLVERGRRKCDIYWPETTREPVYYGDLVVETESESTLPDYVLRVLSVKLGDRTRKVKQLHYLKWPDMGCPETTWLLLNFVGATRLYLPHNDPGPIVVHCSAGVGRTGTFIAVDYLMQHVTSSDVVDIYNYVMKMRNNRPNMVQTEDQYIFIHDCIRDFVNRSDEDSDDGNEEGGGDDSGNPIYANM